MRTGLLLLLRLESRFEKGKHGDCGELNVVPIFSPRFEVVFIVVFISKENNSIIDGQTSAQSKLRDSGV